MLGFKSTHAYLIEYFPDSFLSKLPDIHVFTSSGLFAPSLGHLIGKSFQLRMNGGKAALPLGLPHSGGG